MKTNLAPCFACCLRSLGLLLAALPIGSRANQLAAPTITASARPFNASFTAANVLDNNAATEYASLGQGAVTVLFTTDILNGTWIQFDFGSTVTMDRFVMTSRNNTVDVIAGSRLIASADATFDATDSIVSFNPSGFNGAGTLQQFTPISGRYVRWEVTSRGSTGNNLGAGEMQFLFTPSGYTVLPAPTVLASSPPFSATYAAANAVDGDAGRTDKVHDYASAGAGAAMFMDFDFGVARPLAGFDFWNRPGDRVTTFNLIFATTPDFATPIATNSFTADANGMKVTSATFPAVTARYVRFQTTGSTGGVNTGMREIQFYIEGLLPPTVSQQPQGGTRLVGDSFTFTAQAVGSPPLSYQWQRHGMDILGATNTSLVLSNLQLSDAGNYMVTVSNPGNSATSTVATLTVINPPVDIVSDLRLHYPLDETFGLVAVDNSGHANDGNLQGYGGDDTQWVAGRTNNALRFHGNNGSNEVLRVIDPGPGNPSASLDFSTNSDFTLAAWVKGPATQEVGGALFAKGFGGGGEQYAIDIDAGRYRFFVRNVSAAAAILSAPVGPNGTWQHIVGVYSRTLNRWKLYVNGLEAASGTPFATTLLTNTHDVSIGSRQLNTNEYGLNLDAIVDDVRIYGRALTPADVTALYYDAPPELPGFVQQPQNAYVGLGEAASFSTFAGGTLPLAYQWWKGASPIGNATNTTLLITNAQLTDDADYYMVINNPGGSVTSVVAHLTVVPFLDLRTAPAVASTLFSSSFPATNAFDQLWQSTGPNTARWSSGAPGGPPQWIYVDLGRTYLIRRVFLDWEAAWGAAFTFRYRTAAEGPTSNPNDWHEVASVSGYAQNEHGRDGADAVFDFLQGQLPLPGNTSLVATVSIQTGGFAARYLMLNATAFRPGFNTVSVWELRVEGVNRAPTAGDDIAGGAQGMTLVIPAIKLLANDSDADEDALSLISVNSPSAGGGTVMLTGTNTVAYTAPLTGSSDSFTYTVSDGRGGTASATVNVMLAPGGASFNRVSLDILGNGDVMLSYRGIPHYNYALEWTHNLTPPIQWQPVLTNQANSTGLLVFTNTPSGGNDFYRTRYVP
jgi:hypothetical protein